MSERVFYSIEYVSQFLEYRPSVSELEAVCENVDVVSIAGEEYGRSLYKSFGIGEGPESPIIPNDYPELVEPLNLLYLDYSSKMNEATASSYTLSLIKMSHEIEQQADTEIKNKVIKYHRSVMRSFGLGLLDEHDFEPAIKLLNKSSEYGIFDDASVRHLLWFICARDFFTRQKITRQIFAELNSIKSTFSS